jgi:hypothetical protein
VPHACACSRAPACACARAHAFVSRARLRRRQVEDAGASLGPEGRRALQCAVLALALLLLRRLGQKGVRLVTVATATAYPVYASFKTLESSNLEAHRRWLVYWLCLGIASCLEGTADTAMALVPNYSLAKLSALVVCVYRHTRTHTHMHTRTHAHTHMYTSMASKAGRRFFFFLKERKTFLCLIAVCTRTQSLLPPPPPPYTHTHTSEERRSEASFQQPCVHVCLSLSPSLSPSLSLFLSLSLSLALSPCACRYGFRRN